jgi:hypothetical protein
MLPAINNASEDNAARRLRLRQESKALIGAGAAEPRCNGATDLPTPHALTWPPATNRHQPSDVKRTRESATARISASLSLPCCSSASATASMTERPLALPPMVADVDMAIHRLSEGSTFGPEEIWVMTEAYEIALRTLDIYGREGPLTELVAKKIISNAQKGCG